MENQTRPKTFAPHQQRVIDELKELETKRKALSNMTQIEFTIQLLKSKPCYLAELIKATKSKNIHATLSRITAKGHNIQKEETPSGKFTYHIVSNEKQQEPSSVEPKKVDGFSFALGALVGIIIESFFIAVTLYK